MHPPMFARSFTNNNSQTTRQALKRDVLRVGTLDFPRRLSAHAAQSIGRRLGRPNDLGRKPGWPHEVGSNEQHFSAKQKLDRRGQLFFEGNRWDQKHARGSLVRRT